MVIVNLIHVHILSTTSIMCVISAWNLKIKIRGLIMSTKECESIRKLKTHLTACSLIMIRRDSHPKTTLTSLDPSLAKWVHNTGIAPRIVGIKPWPLLARKVLLRRYTLTPHTHTRTTTKTHFPRKVLESLLFLFLMSERSRYGCVGQTRWGRDPGRQIDRHHVEGQLGQGTQQEGCSGISNIDILFKFLANFVKRTKITKSTLTNCNKTKWLITNISRSNL